MNWTYGVVMTPSGPACTGCLWDEGEATRLARSFLARGREAWVAVFDELDELVRVIRGPALEEKLLTSPDLS